MPTPLRRLLGAVCVLLLAVTVTVGSSGAANAADGFRYWNYFHEQNGSWEFAQSAAAGYTPDDGAVEAYRFGTSTTAAGIEPRVDLDEVNFEAVCAEEKAKSGKKRVAVLLDYGTATDAEGETPPSPRGACAVVAKGANGQEVLESVADLRVEKGLTCAIDGYPLQDCGTPVKDAAPSSAEQPVAFELPAASDSAHADHAAAAADSDEGESDLLWPLLGVALLVGLIAGAALVLNRRNRSA